MRRWTNYYFALVFGELIVSWVVQLAAAPLHLENIYTQQLIAETAVLLFNVVWLILNIIYESKTIRPFLIISQFAVVVLAICKAVSVISLGINLFSITFLVLYTCFLLFSAWVIYHLRKNTGHI